ncbi:MAG TPA: FGGY-family carbohydrate kinase [Vicinamibacterales bacterium]|nr:FGGY-family carbohydrate kinase [Vicinamibacterales bacterium]
MALYLGFDSSTQSLTALVLEVDDDAKRIVFESAIEFDRELPEYGTVHGVLPDSDPAAAVSSPLMWADALDRMMQRLAGGDLDLSRLAAISGSAQQHGSVYLNARAANGLAALDPARPLAGQVAEMLARPVAPIWMDTSTSVECAEIAEAAGGAAAVAQRTGSRPFERFTGPQIRKFFKRDPAAYATTDRIHLVSSFMASLLAGGHATLDPGDGSGMNLMDLEAGRWWTPAIDATAPALAGRLPSLASSSAIVGRLSPYWQRRYRLPPARVVAWSGDNPCTLVGTGLVREGRVAISLGTSDTIFGLMRTPRVDPSGTGHVFGSPTGDYMGLTCFKNGSLARERVRDAFGMTWDAFSRALDASPPGNDGRILIPWFEPEITPSVAVGGERRYGLAADDAPGNVRGVVEAQQLSLALHSRWMGVDIREIHATGGASVNRAILRVMADVFGADVIPFDVANSAALGAVLRAYHADRLADARPIEWDAVVADIAEPGDRGRIAPDARRHALYRDLLRVYEACEAHALGRGPDPEPAIAAWPAKHGNPL